MEVIITAKNRENETRKPEYDSAIAEQLVPIYQQFVLEAIKVISPELDLSTLESIIIPENFVDEVLTFQKTNGLLIEMTNNEFGKCQGKVLKKRNGKRIIFLSKKCLDYFIPDNFFPMDLTSDEKNHLLSNRLFWINSLNHELCHIDYANKTTDYSWLNERVCHFNKPNELFFFYGTELYDEYQACRNSSQTHLLNKYDAEGLIEYCFTIEKRILEQKEKYQSRIISLDSFWSDFLSLTRQNLTVSAYAFGNYYCIEDEKKRNDFKMKIFKGLNGSRLDFVWEEYNEALDHLYKEFPDWKDESVFDELAEVIECYYTRFGITLSPDGNSLYVHIA